MRKKSDSCTRKNHTLTEKQLHHRGISPKRPPNAEADMWKLLDGTLEGPSE